MKEAGEEGARGGGERLAKIVLALRDSRVVGKLWPSGQTNQVSVQSAMCPTSIQQYKQYIQYIRAY